MQWWLGIAAESCAAVFSSIALLQYFHMLQECSIFNYCSAAVFPNNAGMQDFHVLP